MTDEQQPSISQNLGESLQTRQCIFYYFQETKLRVHTIYSKELLQNQKKRGEKATTESTKPTEVLAA